MTLTGCPTVPLFRYMWSSRRRLADDAFPHADEFCHVLLLPLCFTYLSTQKITFTIRGMLYEDVQLCDSV